MENWRKILKYFWFPAIMIMVPFCFASYMAWKECKINTLLVEESLQGNHYAIAILAKYEKPWKLDERIVLSAIQGNKYALDVIGITLTK